MRIIRFFIIASLIAGILYIASCSRPPVEKGVFYTAGNWDIPPAFHGNPWAPGGSNVSGAYVYEPLFVYEPTTGKYIPRLAESCEESEDYLTLTVKLRKNTFWHDGNKFSSRDVQTTFYIGYLKNFGVWDNLNDIECPDENTVIFRWKRFSATNKVLTLTEWITSPYHVFGKWSDEIPDIRRRRKLIARKDVKLLEERLKEEHKVREVLYKYHPEMPIGTGPFKISRVTASDIILDRFDQHYEAKNIKIKKVHIMRWGSNEVVWSYLMAGEVDAVTPACPFDVAKEILKRNPDIKIITPSDRSEFGLIFNCRKPPVSDLKFRQAIAYLLDRDVIRQVSYTYGVTIDDYNLGVPITLRKQWFDDDFYKDLTLYKHNPQKAREILKNAGYRFDDKRKRWQTPKGEDIALEILAPAGLNDLILLAESSCSQMVKFGIHSQVRVVPADLYVIMLQNQNFDIAADALAALGKFSQMSVSYGRFYSQGALIQSATGLPRKLKYKDREINMNKMIMEMDRIADLEKEREKVRILATITNEYLPTLSCYEKRLMIFIADGKRVTGWPPGDNRIWEAAPGGVEMLYSTMIVKGMLKPAE